MPFIASNGLGPKRPPERPSPPRKQNAIHYHDLGTGDPVVFLRHLRPQPNHRMDHVPQGGGRIVPRHYRRASVMDLPNSPEDGTDRLSRGVHSLQRIARQSLRWPRCALYRAGALGRATRRAVSRQRDGGGDQLSRPGREIRNGWLAYRHRRRFATYWPPALRGQPRHPTGDHRPEPREHSPLSAPSTSTDGDARYRRAGGPISIARIPGRLEFIAARAQPVKPTARLTHPDLAATVSARRCC